jgi:hypothetical protein
MDVTELQKQLAEFMAVVKEERRLRHDTETAQQQAEAGLAGAKAEPGQPDAPPKGPKIVVPDKFDRSSPTKAEVYGSQFGLYVVSSPALFPDDLSKVVFALLYLTGAASAWAQPHTQRIFAGEAVAYKEFTEAFQAMYFDNKKKS